MTVTRTPTTITHDLVATNGTGEHRWTACRCGWLSPVVADERTAHQAHQTHQREATP